MEYKQFLFPEVVYFIYRFTLNLVSKERLLVEDKINNGTVYNNVNRKRWNISIWIETLQVPVILKCDDELNYITILYMPDML